MYQPNSRVLKAFAPNLIERLSIRASSTNNWLVRKRLSSSQVDIGTSILAPATTFYVFSILSARERVQCTAEHAENANIFLSNLPQLHLHSSSGPNKMDF